MKKVYTVFANSVAVLLCSAAFCFCGLTTRAQVVFSSWHHPPEVTLYATPTDTTAAGTSANIHLDDSYTGAIPIGFPFTFYDSTYSACLIGTNGVICFDITLAGSYDPAALNDTLIGNSSFYNCICGPYSDMYEPGGGELTYFTTGTTPNRRFVVSYCHTPLYNCTNKFITSQMILYEGSNTIEVHIGRKDVCIPWMGGYAIIGVQNLYGTAATAAPGRDYPNVWTSGNEAWRFTPDASFASYAVDSIPYAPLPYATIYWYDSTTGAYLGSGDSLVLIDTSSAVYMALAISCTDSGTTGIDTTATGYVSLVPIEPTNIAPLNLNTNFSVYPNPASEELNIITDGIITDIAITDLLGQTMLTQQYQSQKIHVHIASLPPGVYFVRINGNMVRRFVKE